jgi:spore germination protein KC
MTFKKALAVLFAVHFTILTAAGCWNYQEVDDLSIVLGAAVDYDRENETVILKVEIVSPAGAGAEAEAGSEFVESLGRTFMDASRNALATAGKRLFWSHAQVIIISEEFAKAGKLSSILDFFTRHHEAKDDIFLLISLNETGNDILDTVDVELEAINSLYLGDTLTNENRSSRIFSVPLWKFVKNWQSKGISPVAPGVRIRPVNESVPAEIYGTAIFKDEQLVGWLNGVETESFLFVIDAQRGGIISTVQSAAGDDLWISYEIIESRTKLNPIYTDGHFNMEININTAVTLIEYGSGLITLDGDRKNQLQTHTASQISKQIGTVIKKVQNEYQSDIFGFGQAVERKYPKLWKQISENWDETFPEVVPTIKVNLEIRRSGLL